MRTLSMALALCLGGQPAMLAGPAIFAVQGHSMMHDAERHRRSVDLMAELGLTMMRDECHWSLVEREAGVFAMPETWSENLDYSISRGVDTLLILNYMNDLYDEGRALRGVHGA